MRKNLNSALVVAVITSLAGCGGGGWDEAKAQAKWEATGLAAPDDLKAAASDACVIAEDAQNLRLTERDFIGFMNEHSKFDATRTERLLYIGADMLCGDVKTWAKRSYAYNGPSRGDDGSHGDASRECTKASVVQVADKEHTKIESDDLALGADGTWEGRLYGVGRNSYNAVVGVSFKCTARRLHDGKWAVLAKLS
jgi:hypothetical protein